MIKRSFQVMLLPAAVAGKIELKTKKAFQYLSTKITKYTKETEKLGKYRRSPGMPIHEKFNKLYFVRAVRGPVSLV